MIDVTPTILQESGTIVFPRTEVDACGPGALTWLFASSNWTEYLVSFIPNSCCCYCLVTFVENTVPITLFYEFHQTVTRVVLIAAE